MEELMIVANVAIVLELFTSCSNCLSVGKNV